jgi:arylsulfatase A-like enzyme
MPTILAASSATTVPDLPGQSLVPLLAGERPAWRTHLYTEFHTHAARANFFPQRAVRGERYKLIENLLPDEINPDMEKIDKEIPFVAAAIASAPAEVRAAYQLQQKPPRFELYDLRADPHEFRNLADSAEHGAVLTDLKQRLLAWREQTHDPLLNPTNLARLKAEVYAVKSKADGKAVDWGYPHYFFGREPPARRDTSPANDRPAKKRKRKQQTE